MNHERKESEEPYSLSKTKPELINSLKEREIKSESNDDAPRNDEERSAELQQTILAESDMAKHAHRVAVNYAKSLLLF
ncbi:hypothetical protein [Sphingobacterium gobiense]|uniref:Uncharacterized protein n=1 Tax=Sphingobacterium gobiense TaxID=1382456 RepID=A0A2S9JUP3_9SPHI|nr:hypothetical protein [Sphingobacterium gobiense]PRD57004.1 hypothetical protein C5749_07290 [Sphingobacterium gobiense]